MFILKKGHQPGVYVPLRALFLVAYHLVLKHPWQNVISSSFCTPKVLMLFCISLCSETPLGKCDLVILLHSKSLKKCHKNFEHWLTNKKCTPKNDLDTAFCMYKGGNTKTFKSKLWQIFGLKRLDFLLFGVGLQHLKRKITIFIFFQKKSDFPCPHFHNGKGPSQDYFWP